MARQADIESVIIKKELSFEFELLADVQEAAGQLLGSARSRCADRDFPPNLVILLLQRGRHHLTCVESKREQRAQ